MLRRSELGVVFLLAGVVCGCGNGGGADPIDARAVDARHDGAVPDAEIPDADLTLPDAEPACALPPFTGGVSTLTGCSERGHRDGARGYALFSNPVNVALGPDGAVYVADFDNHAIRVVDADGATRTLVRRAGFERPFGLAFAADGTLYVSTDRNDSAEHSAQTGTVWRVNRNTGAATVVVRNVGRPRGLAVLADGRIVLSDYLHHTVRLLDPTTGAITPLAGATDVSGAVDGTGAAARFFGPYGVAVLGDGRIAVADLFNHRIRAVALDGAVTTIAGTGAEGAADGAALSATFAHPQDVAVDDGGDLYIADVSNYVVRRLAAGQVTTLVGSGQPGWQDDADLRTAELHGLEGLDVAPSGATLWIADGSRGEDLPHHRIRVVELAD
jgi:DNA-binding beta-propeller fold protein YncE